MSAAAVTPTTEPTELPRSFAAGVRWLWSDFLFPGTAPAAEKLRPAALALLIVLPALALYPCLSYHLFEPDEGRYAEIPREMLARGEWVVPYLQGQPYLDKPPLMYWLVMGSYSLFGVHDWAGRLVAALALHGCVLLTYLFGRRQFGERAAFWGALALALAPGFVGMARLLLLDGLLTFLVTLEMFAALEAVRGGRFRWRWWLLAALACGLGMLTKGPISIVLVQIPLLAHAWLTGHWRLVTIRRAAAFLALALAVALPWYAAICVRLPEFGAHFFWKHNVMRFLQPFDHLEPVWFYLPILLGGLLPGSLLLLPFLRFLFAGDPGEAAKRPPELGYLLLAGGWCVFFFSMSGSKLPTYVLPAFPPLCLALGAFVAATRWHRARLTRLSLGGMYAFMLVAHYWAAPWYAHYRSPMNTPARVLDLCADTSIPVVCYPRAIDSVSFYFGRDDFRSFRSKETADLIRFLQEHPRAVVLFSHRHSLHALSNQLPPHLRITDRVPSGLCHAAVVERHDGRHDGGAQANAGP